MTKSKEIYAYKNTDSTAGEGVFYQIDPKEISHVTKWMDRNGNPYHKFYMKSGTTYLIQHDNAAMSKVHHLAPQYVSRRKDL